MLGRNMLLKIFLYNVTLIRQKNLKNKVKFKNKYVQLGQSPEFLYTEIIIYIWLINAWTLKHLLERKCINLMLSKCNMLTLLVARLCNSPSRMWKGCLHALWIPTATETGVRGRGPPQEGLCPLPTDACFTYSHRVKDLYRSLTLVCIQLQYYSIRLCNFTYICSHNTPWNIALSVQ
jgi:hypothetical protein